MTLVDVRLQPQPPKRFATGVVTRLQRAALGALMSIIVAVLERRMRKALTRSADAGPSREAQAGLVGHEREH